LLREAEAALPVTLPPAVAARCYQEIATLGAEEGAPVTPPPPPSGGFISPFFRAWKYVAPVSALACAYHGYKRNDSLGWALWWFLVGGLPITPVIALAQGFGERKGMTANSGLTRRQKAARKGARTRASGDTHLWDVIRTSTGSTLTTIVEPAWKSLDQVQEEAQAKYGDVFVASKRKQNRRRQRKAR